MALTAILYAVAVLPAAGNLANQAVIDAFASLIGSEHKAEATHCLSIEGKDPPRDVIAALAARKLTVLPGSNCYYADTAPHDYVAKTNAGTEAAFLDISNIIVSSPSSISVKYWHRAGAWQGYGKVIQLRLLGGSWVVVPDNGYLTEE